jgi:hypothetical protein
MTAKPRSLCASAALSLALGCATGPYVGRVQPYGRELIVTYDSMWGAATAREAAVYDANRYCDERELRMMPDSETATQGQRASVALVFHCVSADDPELRPDTRTTP